MNRSASSVLKQYWNYDQFRSRQEDIVNAVLNGRDVLALLPTGGGKSICFQVPTLMTEGLCLVISPLIALMKDQVQNLRRKGITAFAIYSGMNRKEVVATFKLAINSNCRFLYVSPERMETDLFKEFLPAMQITLIAVDEAHCISQWGYDFRPPYLKIADIRNELPGIPILALTATATPLIQQDICEKLKMTNPEIFRQSFLRPNLSFSAQKTSSVMHKMLDTMRRLEGSAIIYCRNRRRTKEISDLLNLHGIKSDFYHAGLDQEERNKKQDQWMKGSLRVIVCTNAFGMGIDKPDVRLVLHVEVPDNLENYYQEAGRAGRDGRKAYAVMLYNEEMLEELAIAHKDQYPPLDFIRQIYQGLVNYLQVPLGTEQVSYPFDINDFFKKFSFQHKPGQSALKTLQQEGYISFNETVFSPATVCFICSKQQLSEFENENPGLEPIIKTLLRSYAGIYDQAVPIFEKSIASILKTDIDNVIKGLYVLHKYQVIEYKPQKDVPQILFRIARRKAADIRIDSESYLFKKNQFVKRVAGMLEYVRTTRCRSQQIAGYFGEKEAEDCGCCDNCIKSKKAAMNLVDFQKISRKLIEETAIEPVEAKDIFDRFSDIHSDHLRKVIDFMQAENKVIVDNDGFIVFKA